MKHGPQDVVIFDIETTGLSSDRDQIIELSFQRGLSEGDPQQSWRIKPEVPISPQAQAVHGISLGDLLDCPKFSDLAPEIYKALDSCDTLMGYNIEFDLNFVQAELRRAKHQELELSKKTLLDPMRLWQSCEPRRLEDAYQRFIGKKLEKAHSSAADVRATGLVFTGMLKSFQLDQKDWDAIVKLATPMKRSWIGPSHHIQWREGVAILGFGKHYGKPIAALAQESKGEYLKWMLERDFPEHVRSIAAEALKRPSSDFEQWLASTYA